MNNLTLSKKNNKKKHFKLKEHKDNTLRSLREVEAFLNCVTKAKKYALLLKLFK